MRRVGYFGSKATSGLCQPLIAMMPPHDTYIETHLGGGAIMRRKPAALHNIGIDRDARALGEFECDYALDASTIDLCLSVFPWALFRSTKSAVKLHTLLDLRGNIPTFIHVSDGKMHDVNVLDILVPERGAFYIMDRGYVDFERSFLLHTVGAFFIIRAKSNTRYERRYSHPVDKTTGVRCDQTVVLTGAKGKKRYPQPVHRIKYYDANTQKTFNFLTNHFAEKWTPGNWTVR